MFNTILLLAALMPVASPNETDSTIAHRIDLDEVTITEFKQNKHNLTPTSVSAFNNRFLGRQEVDESERIDGCDAQLFYAGLRIKTECSRLCSRYRSQG